MKKFFIAAAIALTSMAINQSATAADHIKVDRNTIKTEATSDRYNTLLQNFINGAALAADEAKIVYYGSALQPGFNQSAQYADALEAYNAGQLDKAFGLLEAALAKDPTNLTLLFKAYAAAASSKDDAIKAKATTMQNRLLAICDAIFESGTGVQDASPYIVIRPADIDEFLFKYIQPTKVIGRAKVGNLDAAKVNLDGVKDDVILYFAGF